ncbi:MAG: apolipoprotein N-acyltransferase [Gammaproteobacteria bacterium]
MTTPSRPILSDVGLLLAVVSGCLLPLAFAPFGQFWLAPICFAVLIYVWGGADPWRAFRLGFAFGMASFLCGVYWVYISIHDYGPAPAIFAIAMTLSLVSILAVFPAVAGWVAARWFTTDGPAAWFGVLPAIWVVTEWLRGWIFTGFGWLSAGYSQSDSWLMGFAPVGGVHFMSWAVLLTAGALVMLAQGSTRQRAVAAALVVSIWVSGYVATATSWTEPLDGELSVALVQGAVPQDLKWDPDQLVPTLELYRDLTYASEGSELIVWPEAAIPTLFDYIGEYLSEIRGWTEQNGSDLILGILRADPERDAVQNTIVALGETPSFYVKRHLVPYGEYFPVPAFVRNWLRLMSLPYSDAMPGSDGQRPLEVAGQRIAMSICYEDVFGAEQLHYLPEATLLVNVSNDAWFGDSIAPHQHLEIARVRAAEAGRYLLRATNTGVSGIIDPSGDVVATSPQFEPQVLKGTVRGYAGATPYARWGNVAVITACFVILLLQFATTKFTIRPGT